MALLFLYSLAAMVPNRTAVRLFNAGRAALLAGHYATAERDFAGTLRRESRSTHARLGLACAFFLTGHRSRALLELTMAVQHGLNIARVGECGHGFDFDRSVFTAKFGLTNSFAVPRTSPSYQRELTSLPNDTPTDDARRLLLGSCLAFRARLDGAGWYYAANAHDLGRIIPSSERDFFACLGSTTRTRLGCQLHPRLGDCIFTVLRRDAFLRDRPYLYPAEAPEAFSNA
jgi:hypothetical protein